jgi:DNA-binding NarL/FixJ family response regulator
MEETVYENPADLIATLPWGAHCCISPRTVEIHRSKMMRKLALRNQIDLIRYALKRCILPND